MGNSSSSTQKALEYGTIKTTGAKLFELGVIVLEQGQIELGKSPDLHLKVSSFEHGVFHIEAKYLGKSFKELGFKHAHLIELLHGSEVDSAYQALVETYSYRREGFLLPFGRGFSFDVTKLLPYLYQSFLLQELEEEGERLVQQSHFRRLSTATETMKRAKEGRWEDPKKATEVQGVQQSGDSVKVVATTTTDGGRRRTQETIVKLKG